MVRLELSKAVLALMPGLQLWLDNAGFETGIADAVAPREKGVVRIMLDREIAAATYRDILVTFPAAKPDFRPATNGMPARVAFGLTDMEFAMALIAELARPQGMPAVGDAASARLMALASRIAASDATVLIQGETGTGKEGMARFLHLRSARADRDFIAVNCAALPETMMEAMLFGHKKGSFTGASNSSEGLFQAADGGTLFLDEIAELPIALQAKLLRALQEGEVLPVGATHPVPVNVRVIAACNRDLAAECELGRFRSDLYWRLNVMPLQLQPLSRRRLDICAISASILIRQHAQAPAGAHFPWPTKEAVDCLMGHDWPGNARELGNVLQRAIVLRESEQIGLADLHMTARPIMSSPAAAMPVEPTLAEPVRRAGRPTRLQIGRAHV